MFVFFKVWMAHSGSPEILKYHTKYSYIKFNYSPLQESGIITCITFEQLLFLNLKKQQILYLQYLLLNHSLLFQIGEYKEIRKTSGQKVKVTKLFIQQGKFLRWSTHSDVCPISSNYHLQNKAKNYSKNLEIRTPQSKAQSEFRDVQNCEMEAFGEYSFVRQINLFF